MTVDLTRLGIAELAPVRVVDYSSSWPRNFTRLAQALLGSLQPVIADLQHIGGTAVPGLAGSGIIDVLAITRNLQQFDAQISRLYALGYRPARNGNAVAYGSEENQRRFQLGVGHNLQAQLFVSEAGTKSALHHLLVRDYLRHNALERDRYSALKRRLTETGADSPRAYSTGKSPRLTRLLEQATGRR